MRTVARGRVAPDQPRPAWLPQGLYPFESRFIEIAGARVHYLDEGEGPPLLLLHGNPTWSFLYREIVAGLTDRFRCVAPDYPGFGLSEAPAGYGFRPAEHAAVIEQLVRKLKLRDATLMVQDWGGPIGFAVATRQPERFRRFVIANTMAWPKRDPAVRMFSWAAGSPLGGYLLRNRNLFVEAILPAAIRRGPLSPAVMAAYRGPFPTSASRRPLQVFPREIAASRDFLAAVEGGLPALRDRPALILWGTKDVAFGPRERKRFEREFPHHRTVLLEGAGHFIQEDAPDEVVRAIRQWSDDEDARELSAR